MNIHPELMLIPGYAELVKHENDLRDAAILELPANICGKQVMQMTLRHWLILSGVDSPFLSARLPSPEDVVQFLWIMSPGFSRISRCLKNVKRFPRLGKYCMCRRCRFVESCRNIPYGDAVVKLIDFVKDSFHDKPRVYDGGSEYDTPIVSFVASVVHQIAVRYHWPKEKIINLPIKEVFQYLKLIRMRDEAESGQPPSRWNPSDKFRRDWIREQRRLSREQKQKEESN